MTRESTLSDPDLDEHLMRAALAQAQIALERGELPVGAVVARGDQILSAAATCERATGRLLVHAELLALEAVDALAALPGRRRDLRLVTTVEPCLMCMGAALSSFVGAVVYAVEAPSDGAVALARGWVEAGGHLPDSRFPAIRAGVLRSESLALFRDYVARTDPAAPTWRWAQGIAALD